MARISGAAAESVVPFILSGRTSIIRARIIPACIPIITKEFVEPYVTRKELVVLNDGKTYQDPLSLAWYHRPEPPNYFQALVDTIE